MTDAVVLSPARQAVKPPKRYKVVLLNDDFTPMDFVVDLLMKFFRMDYDKAMQVMLAIHKQGKGICGIYTREIAETKCYQVNRYARDHQHPLLCQIEAE